MRTVPWREQVLVLAVMTGLSLLMTWPLARDLSGSINDHGDPLLNSWILWWVVKALFTPGLSLFNAPIFYPEPLTLAYSEHLLVSALTVAPVLLLGGDALLAHNVMFLVALVVAGWGAYLLGYELTGSRGAAWVCALAFAFNPFRFGHLGHLQMQTNQFMPLVLLYLHRWAAAPRWPLALGLGLFWLLQILSCGYYALFISLAVVVFLLYYGMRGRWWKEARRLVQLAVVGLGVAVLVLPMFLPYVTVKREMGFKRAESQAAGFAAEPKHYLAAPPANLLYGRATEPWRAPEGELFLGLTLTGLAVIGLRRRTEPASVQAPRLGLHQGYYLLLSLVAFWAALGPGWGLYDLLYKLVPGFDAIRVPARLAVLVTLAWAVLAAMGWARLEQAWAGRPRLRRAGLVLASGLILLEACSLPIPWLHIKSEGDLPVYQWLAGQPKGSVVMEFPALGFQGDQARDARYLYWATKHGQTLVNGYSGFFPASYLELARQAQRLGKGDLLEKLVQRGARLIIVHTNEYSPSDRGWLINKLAKEPRLRLVYNDRWDYAYEVLPGS